MNFNYKLDNFISVAGMIILYTYMMIILFLLVYDATIKIIGVL